MQEQYREQLMKINKSNIKATKQEEKPVCSPISQIFKQKQAKMWKSTKDKIEPDEGTIVEEISYHFYADLNFKAYQTPTQIYPSFNNTFIVFFAGDSTRGSKVVHYTSTGTVIKLIYIQKGKLQVQMLSEKLVLIFIQNHGSQHRIQQWDIEKHERITIPYLQVFRSNVEMMIFPKSQLFCLCQFVCYRWKARVQLSLTYFQYPILRKEDTFIAQISRSFKKYTENDQISMMKLNQQSMVGFINTDYKSEKYTRFCTYSLGKQNKIIQQIHKFPNDFHQYSDICQCRITNLWEVDQNMFMINLRTEINLNKIDYEEEQEKYDDQAQKQIQRNHTFVWDCKRNIYRKAKFDLDQDTQIQLLECFESQQRIVARRPNLHQRYLRENFQMNPNLPSKVLPVKYIDVINEKIVLSITPTSQQTTFVREQAKKSYPAYLPNYEIHSFVSVKGLVNIWVRRVKCLKFPPSEIAIFFMDGVMKGIQDEQQEEKQEILQEWDEDLLYYICQITEGKDQMANNYQTQSKISENSREKQEEQWL